jgi:hypothetical protein
MTGIEPAYSAWEAISTSERVSDNGWSGGDCELAKLQDYLRFRYGWRTTRVRLRYGGSTPQFGVQPGYR